MGDLSSSLPLLRGQRFCLLSLKRDTQPRNLSWTITLNSIQIKHLSMCVVMRSSVFVWDLSVSGLLPIVADLAEPRCCCRCSPLLMSTTLKAIMGGKEGSQSVFTQWGHIHRIEFEVMRTRGGKDSYQNTGRQKCHMRLLVFFNWVDGEKRNMEKAL